MRHSAGRRLRGLLRDEYRHRHRQIGWLYLPGIAAYCAAASVLIVCFAWTAGASGAWFAAGFGVGLAPLFLWVALHSEEAGRIEAAAIAEEWVEEELDKLAKIGWHAHHNLQLEGRDVDHVAVGPGGVIVIETKWSSHDLRDQSAITERIVRRHEHQLARNIRSINAVLKQHGSDASTRGGLIALGGPRRPSVIGRSSGGVRVVPIDQLAAFFHDLAPRLSTDQVDRARKALTTFEERRRRHESMRG